MAAAKPSTRVVWPDPGPAAAAPRLALPDRVTSAQEALQALAELWPVLLDALEPGPTTRLYTRRAGNRTGLNPWCEVCGARRWWRATTWTSPPTDHHGPERRRPYCRRCDSGQLNLPPSAAAAAIGPLDTLLAAERVLADIQRSLLHVLGVNANAPLEASAFADGGDRLGQITELLTAAARWPAVHADAEHRLIDAAHAVQATLRDVEPVIAIDARCPWCGTLSLVMWPERGPANAHNVAGLVACTYPACVCELDTCRCHRRAETTANGHRPHAGYRHHWTNADWGWLSRRIDINLYDVARG